MSSYCGCGATAEDGEFCSTCRIDARQEMPVKCRCNYYLQRLASMAQERKDMIQKHAKDMLALQRLNDEYVQMRCAPSQDVPPRLPPPRITDVLRVQAERILRHWAGRIAP